MNVIYLIVEGLEADETTATDVIAAFTSREVANQFAARLNIGYTGEPYQVMTLNLFDDAVDALAMWNKRRADEQAEAEAKMAAIRAAQEEEKRKLAQQRQDAADIEAAKRLVAYNADLARSILKNAQADKL